MNASTNLKIKFQEFELKTNNNISQITDRYTNLLGKLMTYTAQLNRLILKNKKAKIKFLKATSEILYYKIENFEEFTYEDCIKM